MELRDRYKELKDKNFKFKTYNDLKKYFLSEVAFSKKDSTKNKTQINLETNNLSRVWLLFASNDKSHWDCLQVAHSKKYVRDEVESAIEFLLSKYDNDFDEITYTNSAFYKKVCPYVKGEEYRKCLYSKIGYEYKHFRFCFLDVDKYLGIEKNKDSNTDTERIAFICINQYAEAKIAFQTLAVYWRLYSSGIDGQTIDYITKNPTGFEE